MGQGPSHLPWWKQWLFWGAALGIGSVLMLLGAYALFLPVSGGMSRSLPRIAWVQAVLAAVLLLLSGLALRRRGVPGFEEAVPWGGALLPWVLGHWLQWELR